MATGNRAVTFMGPHKMEVQDKGYPKLQDPKGRKIEHAVILKLITTNICGSDLHIYNGRFEAPKGMLMGHENTGEVLRAPDRSVAAPPPARNSSARPASSSATTTRPGAIWLRSAAMRS
jgi:threonine dehydrogenase-like Zn-dependent dehydrogenase